MTSRRRVLRASAVTIPLVGLAGCINPSDDAETPTETPTDTPTGTPTDTTPTDELDVENPEPVSDEAFDKWEPDTNCNDGEMEAMYNSEISVNAVRDDLSDSYNPIAYDDLPKDEKIILAEVLERGGYDTCETEGGFDSFLGKAVYDYADEQDGDDMNVFLEYDGRYYQLYLRKQDQVFTY